MYRVTLAVEFTLGEVGCVIDPAAVADHVETVIVTLGGLDVEVAISDVEEV